MYGIHIFGSSGLLTSVTSQKDDCMFISSSVSFYIDQKLCCPCAAMKAHGDLEVQIHSILTMTLNRING
jgi:hypothetical protein